MAWSLHGSIPEPRLYIATPTKTVVTMYYGLKLSQSAIARSLGVSQPRISHVLQNSALRRLETLSLRVAHERSVIVATQLGNTSVVEDDAEYVDVPSKEIAPRVVAIVPM